MTHTRTFISRHIDQRAGATQNLLDRLAVDTEEELIEDTIPSSIQRSAALAIPEALTEEAYIQRLKTIMDQNELYTNYIGMGYYDSFTPAVIQRNILENPGWYTAYTPYQAEIAQGRLEALANFQTMVMDLTGMEIANASLLDEGTAAAEAMSMLYSKRPRAKKEANVCIVDSAVFPQTLSILASRAEAIGITLRVEDIASIDTTDDSVFCIIGQYPDNDGAIKDPTQWIENATAHDITTVVIADLMSLTVLKAPGEMGAQVVVGTTQRFGIPMGYGGPHAAFFATREKYKRAMPGRVIGLSKDKYNKPAYRMALQTREQHIKREKATSNICTAQVLLAVMAGFYAVYHGPKGLTQIAQRISGYAHAFNKLLEKHKISQVNDSFFDTLKISLDDVAYVRSRAQAAKINLRYFEDGHHVGISFSEKTTAADCVALAHVFGMEDVDIQDIVLPETRSWESTVARDTDFLTHPVFQNHQTEHELLRYIKSLENKDLSLTHAMIALGSCTMKLNATTEMLALSWDKVGGLHPFAPKDQVKGYSHLIEELGKWLCEITDFAAISFQPNSGAQGELAGLMAIRSYQRAQGQGHRNIALIPSSAHGTNPASAVMAGLSVVIVACDDHGNIDMADLTQKAEKHREHLSALMITYPSTHGVFETAVKDICALIHDYGGQVYMDGANMNAQVGLTSPGIIGADVCHLNLHKTFCIPHGGGGPGMGPIGVAAHLAPYLPTHPIQDNESLYSIASAPYGSASILTISHAYIALMGGEGLREATKRAILNANYMRKRLEADYQVLYLGEKGYCAHEFIIDCRPYKPLGIEVTDIAKRLMDYGFHAPTVSFPVAGTMMIEPTESETIEELDRFCDALIQIKKEINKIAEGQYPQDNNPLVNAPHTLDMLVEEWTFAYSREEAIFPLPYVRHNKFWPTVARIDNAYGDRNLVCSCAPIEAYMEGSQS